MSLRSTSRGRARGLALVLTVGWMLGSTLAVWGQGTEAEVRPGEPPSGGRSWHLGVDAGVAISSYFGGGWQDALSERENNDPVVPVSETRSRLYPGIALALLVETDITPTAPTAPNGRFFPDALRVATGLSWQRLGGRYRYSDPETTGTQSIARDYLTIPAEVGLRGTIFDWPVGYHAALGPALMIPVGGVLVRTELDGSTEETIYAADAFRAIVPAGTARLGIDYPLGPGRLGITARAVVTILDIEAGSDVWLWGVSSRVSYTITTSELARTVGGLFQ